MGDAHVAGRVAYVGGALGSAVQLLDGLQQAGGVGLAGNGFAFSMQHLEKVGEKSRDDILHAALVFVRKHRKLASSRFQLGKRLGHVRVMARASMPGLGVKRLPISKRLGAHGLGGSLGKGAVNQALRAVAHEAADGGVGVRGVAEVRKGLVGDVDEVGHGVQDGSVQVEDERVEYRMRFGHRCLLKNENDGTGPSLMIDGAGDGTRTRECELGKLVPYHLATPACLVGAPAIPCRHYSLKRANGG